MFERFHRKSAVATVAALLAALGAGGVAIAQSGGSKAQPTLGAPPAKSTPEAQEAPEAPGQESNAPENSAADPDDVQQGDQSGPDTEQPGTEKESGSEKVDDDGPGGHADEPGNPNADHQAQGQE